jgi:uncharacterized protein YggE
MGHGAVRIAPDAARVSVGVSVLEPEASKAAENAAATANAVIEALVSADIERGDITTSLYAINPEYDHTRDGRRLLGYRVDNTLTIHIRGIDQVGAVLDAVIAAGGDAVVIHGLALTVEDEAPLLEEARALAWADALAKARHLAGLAGLTLGDPLFIAEFLPGTPPIPLSRMMAVEGATPIEAGTMEVRVGLQVRFETS